MSACKVCGNTSIHPNSRSLCWGCHPAWDCSPEFRRSVTHGLSSPRGRVAFVDFCTRVRLEHQNGGAK